MPVWGKTRPHLIPSCANRIECPLGSSFAIARFWIPQAVKVRRSVDDSTEIENPMKDRVQPAEGVCLIPLVQSKSVCDGKPIRWW